MGKPKALAWILLLVRTTFMGLIWALTLVCHAWALGALWFCAPPTWRIPGAIFYAVSFVLLFIMSKPRLRAIPLSLAAFLAVAFWWNSIIPDPDTRYIREVSQAPFAEQHGRTIMLHHVRNNHYRTAEDFDLVYETRTLNLDKLETLDFLVNYWGMDTIAHAFLSFGFSDGQHLAVSVEIRPKEGDQYDMIKGFFKQYALIYIWGDEQDIIGLRTNIKHEDVYLYRTVFNKAEIERILLDELAVTNQLYLRPVFYNTWSRNCTNVIADHLKRAVPERDIPFRKWPIISGSIDRRSFEMGFLMQDAPFPEMRQKALINDRAIAAGFTPAFSRRIRDHLPSSAAGNSRR